MRPAPRPSTILWGATPTVGEDITRVDAVFLRQLKMLVHPDKHGNSVLSHKVWERIEKIQKALDNNKS